MDKTEQHKKAMIEALEKTLGVVTQACKIAGVGRTSHYMWMNEDEAYKNSVQNISDIAIDFVESQLFSQIKEGNTTAAIFYLKTKAKHRGYVERVENDISFNKDSGEIKITIIPSNGNE